MRDIGSTPGWGRSPGGGHGNPTPVFLPGKFHGQRSLVGYIHEVTKSRTQLKRLGTHACSGGGESRKGSLNQGSGVSHICPLLRESLSGIFLSALSLMQGQMAAGGSLPSWNKSAQSTVLADATRNFSFGASDRNELYVSWDPPYPHPLELSGSVKLFAPLERQDKERNDCQCLEGVCRVGWRHLDSR